MLLLHVPYTVRYIIIIIHSVVFGPVLDSHENSNVLGLSGKRKREKEGRGEKGKEIIFNYCSW